MQVEKLKTIDADTLLSTPIRKTLFVVDGLIPQGLSVLSGSSKIGKSWLMLWLGVQVARGQHVWDFETRKSDVLYLCLEDTLQNNSQEAYRLYYEFTEKKSFGVTIQKAHFFKGNLKTAKKITGLKALYFRYLYLLGVLPKNKKHKPLSPEMREACRWLDRHTAQVQLICDNRLTDISSVESFIKNADSEIKLISDYRKMLYRDIDSCHNPDEKAKLVAKRDDCTKALAQLRKDRKTAARIIEDNPKIKENILIEENMRSRYFGLNRSRKRGYER